MLSTLLATKLHRPRPTASLMARPRLTERLDVGLRNGRRLFQVVTPAVPLWHGAYLCRQPPRLPLRRELPDGLIGKMVGLIVRIPCRAMGRGPT